MFFFLSGSDKFLKLIQNKGFYVYCYPTLFLYLNLCMQIVELILICFCNNQKFIFIKIYFYRNCFKKKRQKLYCDHDKKNLWLLHVIKMAKNWWDNYDCKLKAHYWKINYYGCFSSHTCKKKNIIQEWLSFISLLFVISPLIWWLDEMNLTLNNLSSFF